MIVIDMSAAICMKRNLLPRTFEIYHGDTWMIKRENHWGSVTTGDICPPCFLRNRVVAVNAFPLRCSKVVRMLFVVLMLEAQDTSPNDLLSGEDGS